jgi:hypothetical protein
LNGPFENLILLCLSPLNYSFLSPLLPPFERLLLLIEVAGTVWLKVSVMMSLSGFRILDFPRHLIAWLALGRRTRGRLWALIFRTTEDSTNASNKRLTTNIVA